MDNSAIKGRLRESSYYSVVNGTAGDIFAITLMHAKLLLLRLYVPLTGLSQAYYRPSLGRTDSILNDPTQHISRYHPSIIRIIIVIIKLIT